MNKSVWIFQYPKEVREKGSDRASWYIGWYDLNGKRHSESCGSGSRGHNKAEKRHRRIQSELDMGVHQPVGRKKWSEFVAEYDTKVLSSRAAQTREQAKVALAHFTRLAAPQRIDLIKTQTIDDFVAARLKERGKNPKSEVSPATVNKELRHIKAALNKARKWDYLPKMPEIEMVREPEKLIRYVTAEHFSKIYHEASKLTELPRNPHQPYEPADWWKALVTVAYMTGWRIRELLSLRWEDVDLEARTLITRHLDNKGKRDELVPIHPIVVEHIRRLVGKSTHVFQWAHEVGRLWGEFGRIQRAVGIKLMCREDHEHTLACEVYGFHDLRRAFATVNAKRMKPEVLQKLMRHKSYQTTLGYVNLVDEMSAAVDDMPVPDSLRNSNPPDPEAD